MIRSCFEYLREPDAYENSRRIRAIRKMTETWEFLSSLTWYCYEGYGQITDFRVKYGSTLHFMPLSENGVTPAISGR